jgi:hypothetical protein
MTAPGRGDEFCTEPIRLKLGAVSQIPATDTGRKAKEVLEERRGTSLTTRREALQHDGVKSFRSCVNGGRQPGRPGANNSQVAGDFTVIVRRHRAQQTGRMIFNNAYPSRSLI